MLPGAQAALDIALWDLVARRADVPLYQLLGGARTRLPAYASTPLLADARAYVEFVAEVYAQGFRAVKFHAWCEPDRDLEMLRAVHEAHGDKDIAFMHDAEQRYDHHAALRVARELDELGFAWLEAPLPDQDLDGYPDLRRRVGVPILPAGNTVLDIQQVGQALPCGRGMPCASTSRSQAVSPPPASSRASPRPGAPGRAAELGLHPDPGGQPAPRPCLRAHRATSSSRAPGALRVRRREPLPRAAGRLGRCARRAGLGIVVDWERMQAATLASCTCTAGLQAS